MRIGRVLEALLDHWPLVLFVLGILLALFCR